MVFPAKQPVADLLPVYTVQAWTNIIDYWRFDSICTKLFYWLNKWIGRRVFLFYPLRSSSSFSRSGPLVLSRPLTAQAPALTSPVSCVTLISSTTRCICAVDIVDVMAVSQCWVHHRRECDHQRIVRTGSQYTHPWNRTTSHLPLCSAQVWNTSCGGRKAGNIKKNSLPLHIGC